MADLFPTFAVPTVIDDAAATSTVFPQGPAFDLDAGDFATDGAGRIMTASGKDTWIMWCIRCAATERGACAAYSDNYGPEIEEAMDDAINPDSDSKQAALEKTITEALLADPLGRTSAVRDFVFTWDGDACAVSFTIEAKDGSVASINIQV